MKVTLQWMLITVLLCLAHCIAASPYDNSKYLQEKYFSPKRTKPSLSIVNPLDVLRQRIMLEMARRQMRENTKQVEMNKAILKTIGKRGNEIDYNDVEDYIKNRYYDTDIIATPFVNNERSASTNQDDGKVIFNNSNKNYNYKNHYNRKPTSSLTNEVVDNLQIGAGANGPDERSMEAVANDGNNDVATDNNDEAQVKYIYSLYKSRLLNNM